MNDNIIPSIILHPGELAQFPLNANSHPPAQIDELVASRERFSQYRNVVGWRCPQDIETQTADGQPVTLKKGVMYVIAGNGFHAASVKRQDGSIEVKDYSHLSLDEAILLAETDNAAPLGAQRLVAQLQANLERARGLYQDDERMRRMFDRLKAQAGVNGKGQAGNDAEPQIDKAQQLKEKWGVELGQLWQLGEHRLICGDCTDRATVERVMRGERACLVFTDPPYGVAIGAKNRLLNSFQPSGRNLADIESDSLSPDELKTTLTPAFVNVRQIVMADDCTVFVTAPQVSALWMMMMMMMIDAGLPVRHILIWKKNQPTFSLGRLDYDYQHEPILLTWGKRHKRPMLGNHRTSVWEIDRPRASVEHATMKPVELVENALLNNSDSSDVVYDGYIGSGTTLIACENLNRRCRAIEIDPGYVAVTLQRWADLTGLTPTLIDQGAR